MSFRYVQTIKYFTLRSRTEHDLTPRIRATSACVSFRLISHSLKGYTFHPIETSNQNSYKHICIYRMFTPTDEDARDQCKYTNVCGIPFWLKRKGQPMCLFTLSFPIRSVRFQCGIRALVSSMCALWRRVVVWYVVSPKWASRDRRLRRRAVSVRNVAKS